MISDEPSALSHALQLLLSPLEDPFRRFLDVCDDVHMRDANRNTLLHWAATVGNVAAAYALLEHGVEVDARNVYGATPLHLAAAFGPNVGVMGPLLMRYGASLTTKLTSRSATGVESLLASRDLTAGWAWMCELNTLLVQKNDSNVSLFRSGSSSNFPSAASIRAMPPLLCAPEELWQLSQGQRSSMQRACATGSVATIPIPRAPDKRRPVHDGAAGLLKPKQSAKPPLSYCASMAAVSSATAACPTSLQSATKGRETVVAFFMSREETGRIQLEKEQVEALLEIYMLLCPPLLPLPAVIEEEAVLAVDKKALALSPLVRPAGLEWRPDGEDSSSGLIGFIVAVLGEKCDTKGGRQLLVQYNERAQRAGSDDTRVAEAWCPLDSVAHDPVVVAYIDHYSRTYVLTNSVKVEVAATPSILKGEGDTGGPLDTMERDQLEEQLRMLPRRNLSSRESVSSLFVSPKSSNSTTLSTRCRSDNACYLERNGRAADALSSSDTAIGADVLAASHAQVKGEEENGYTTWVFAQTDLHVGSPANPRWSTTAPSAPPPPTLRQNCARAAQDVAASALTSHARASGRSKPDRADAFVPVRHRFSLDTDGPVSGVSSTVDTHVSASSNHKSASEFLEKDGRQYLSESQKAMYNRFLRDSALQRLQTRQTRLSSRASGA
ncbi:putative Ankyrin repeat (3 copies)/Ankyrin repeat (many copies) [Leishmania shawi]|uniref:Ankyrin repeat (3 copies)/Ankyrin repeat (Many copies) n=1 Tax=Leishmania shawi TaxID=5680 RepID=A0AAW3BEI7_9TRYP